MPTLDGLSTALLNVLKPAGVPVGTLGAVWNRTQPVPYQGAVPALFIRPLHVDRSYIAARAKVDDVVFELTYLDSTPSQQNTSIATIETAMYANRESILAAIEGNVTLSSAAVVAGVTITEDFDPQGPFIEAMGQMWVSLTLHVSVKGTKITV